MSGRKFSEHPKAACWHADNDLKPYQVAYQSNKEFWFLCDTVGCNHKLQLAPGQIARGRWCKYCCEPPKALCEDVNCTWCLEKSFASHPRAKYWSKKNSHSPREVFKSSNSEYTFDCDNCGHEFDMLPYVINCQNVWCPYCCYPPKKLCDKLDCKRCFEKSFASHPRAIQWSKNNKLPPRDVFMRTGKKYLFDCDMCGNEFAIAPDHIVGANAWCAVCQNKTEKILLAFLKERYKEYTIIKEAKFDWCIWPETGEKCRFDFYIVELALIVELDGRQHFEQVRNWLSPDDARDRDIFKMASANRHGITVVRLIQEDVYRNKNNWDTHLVAAVKKYPEPTRVFICSKDEYANHIREKPTPDLDKSPITVPDVGNLDIFAELKLK